MSRIPQSVSFLYGAFNNTEHKEVSVEEAIEQAKCNYEVEKQPLIKVTQSMLDAIKLGMPIEGLSIDDIITSHCATTRTDSNKTLGIVGKDYGVVQNTKAFEFVNFLTDVCKEAGAKKPIIETAGALGNGERMYVSCKLDNVVIDGDHKGGINQYALFTNTHDGSGAVMAMFTPVRVICQNTLNMALHGAKNKVIFKHTKHVEKRLDWEIEENRRKAFEVFSRSVKFTETFKDAMLNLKDKKVTAKEIKDFTARVCLNDDAYKAFVKNDYNVNGVGEISTTSRNRMDKLTQSIEFGIGQEYFQGTKLWLLNGLTTFLHNDRAYKTTEDEFKSLMEGDGLKKVQLAYDWLTA